MFRPAATQYFATRHLCQEHEDVAICARRGGKLRAPPVRRAELGHNLQGRSGPNLTSAALVEANVEEALQVLTGLRFADAGVYSQLRVSSTLQD